MESNNYSVKYLIDVVFFRCGGVVNYCGDIRGPQSRDQNVLFRDLAHC